MPSPDPADAYLARLRGWRNRREYDHSLGFLRDQFKREVEKPAKQLSAMAAIWDELLPAELARHTRLEAISRGILRVSVDSSSRLYEINRLLRDGLETELIKRHKGPAVRKIQLRVAAIESEAETRSAKRKEQD